MACEPKAARVGDPRAIADDQIGRVPELAKEREQDGNLAEREEARDIRKLRGPDRAQHLDDLEPGPREDDNYREEPITAG